MWTLGSFLYFCNYTEFISIDTCFSPNLITYFWDSKIFRHFNTWKEFSVMANWLAWDQYPVHVVFGICNWLVVQKVPWTAAEFHALPHLFKWKFLIGQLHSSQIFRNLHWAHMYGKIQYLVFQSPQKVFISRSCSLPKQQTFAFAFAFRFVAKKQMNPLSKNC